MITEEKCYCGKCDNCGEQHEHLHEGWAIFPDEQGVIDSMDSSEWYCHGNDPNHADKHYCPKCFKYTDGEDDKIVINTSRKKS